MLLHERKSEAADTEVEIRADQPIRNDFILDLLPKPEEKALEQPDFSQPDFQSFAANRPSAAAGRACRLTEQLLRSVCRYFTIADLVSLLQSRLSLLQFCFDFVRRASARLAGSLSASPSRLC